MKISADLAQKIVDDMRLVLNHKVNFMDTNANIIASSDPERIGNYHGGAFHVLKKKTPLLIEYDHQFKGAKKGINMPIYFDNQIIGVIGVSGESEVVKYTQIVKTMTEMILKEAYLNIMSFQKREKHRLIIETLLLDAGNLYYDTIFGIDFKENYHVIVGSPLTQDFDLGYLHQSLESILNQYPKIYFTISFSMIIMLAPIENIRDILTLIQNKTNELYNIELFFSIGTLNINREDMKKSFETAKQGLSWAVSQGGSDRIIEYSELDLGMIVVATSADMKSFYLKRVFGKLSHKNQEQLILILEVFARHNGSISRCAEELFIHKNTFQYQLNKIKQITGYDPRIYQDFAVLYMALLFMKQEHTNYS